MCYANLSGTCSSPGSGQRHSSSPLSTLNDWEADIWRKFNSNFPPGHDGVTKQMVCTPSIYL